MTKQLMKLNGKIGQRTKTNQPHIHTTSTFDPDDDGKKKALLVHRNCIDQMLYIIICLVVSTFSIFNKHKCCFKYTLQQLSFNSFGAE